MTVLKKGGAALALAAAISLAGCSTTLIKPTQEQVGTQRASALKALTQLRSRPTPLPQIRAEHEAGVYIPVHTIIKHVTNPNGELQVTVNRKFDDLQSLAQEITQLTGIPVVVSPEALQASMEAIEGGYGMGGYGMGGYGMGSPMAPNEVSRPMVPSIPTASYPSAFGASPFGASPYDMMRPIRIDYSGPLSGLLNVAAARFGVSWAWLGRHRVRFYLFATRTFQLAALPGDLSMSNTVGNTTGGSSGTGSSATSAAGGTSSAGSTANSSASTSSQKTGVSFSDLSVWKAVQASIKSMLSPQGKVSVTSATGTVTVTDTPEVLSEVAAFIKQENASLTDQVIVNVRVLSVQLTKGDQYGIDWGLVYSALSKNLGWSFSNAFTAGNITTGAPNLTLKVLSTAGSATNSDIQAWEGSKALIAALSTQGSVSQVTSASLTTLNDQTAPFQVGHQNSYLASSTTTTATGVGATTTLQPGVVNTGFALNVVPHVLSKRQLLLQFTINLSSLVSIDTVTSGGSSIQTPNIDQRDFMQRVKLDSGNTLVLAGFEQTSLNASSEGPGSAKNTWLGGGESDSNARDVLVILIQPYIVKS